MPELKAQITWVYCTDLDQACEFYAQLLGLPLWRDAGKARIFETGGDAMIGVCEIFADRVVEPAGGMITLLTDEVDAWFERLTARGATVWGPPEAKPEFGIYSFFCEDPNGYVIEFQRFLDDQAR